MVGAPNDFRCDRASTRVSLFIMIVIASVISFCVMSYFGIVL